MSILPLDYNSFDDILGRDESALDRPLVLTTFPNELARTKTEQTISLRKFAEQVHRPRARTKAQLPLLKLARFGDVPTTKGSLRNNANVLSIDGIEGDYDGESVGIAEAASLLKAVNRRPKGTPYRRAKGTPFVEQRDGYDGRAVRAGCGVGRA